MTAPATTPVVDLRRASFGYADRVVTADVDLRIDPGEAVALLGANGSGKSTLVKGVLGLCDHLGGEVDLFGTPLSEFTRRHLIGYVPQRHTLSASVAATVEEIVGVGRLPHQGLLARPTREDRRIVAESLDLVGLAEFARTDVANLSGGQQRRALIARALAAKPEILVMDEPTAGVDAANQRALVEVLERLALRGTTLLVITHELAPMRELLTRAAVMSAGRLVHDGPVDVGTDRHDAALDGTFAAAGAHCDDVDPAAGADPRDRRTRPGPVGLGNVVERPAARPGGSRG